MEYWSDGFTSLHATPLLGTSVTFVTLLDD